VGSIMQDLWHAFRRLRNNPGFSLVAVLTLTLGIGANAAMFSIVNSVLLRPLPYRDPQRLVVLAEQWPQFPRLTVSYLNYKDFRDQSHSFEAMGALRNATVTLTGGAEAELVPSQNLTANLFDILDAEPEIGRTFTKEEDAPGAANVALISHSLWQRRFSSSRNVLGQAITLDNQSYSIIGVMPPGFEVLQQSADVIIPFEPWARTLPDDRSWHPGIFPIARLAPGISLEQARTEMELIAKRLEKQYPDTNNNVAALVDSMQAQIVGNVRPALLLLTGAVAVVLLIACVNVGSLLLARSAARRREIAVCSALGARTLDIVRQLVAESLLLAFTGAVLGILFALAAVPVFVRLAQNSLPRGADVSMDIHVLGFTAIIATIAGILFGLAPARQAWSVDLRDALNDSNRAGPAPRVLHTRAALVVCEIALAVVLLVGAGLLFKSFERLSQVSPGFSTDHVLVGSVVRSPVTYRDPNVRLSFFDSFFAQVAALPGVRGVGGISFLPVTGTGSALHFNIQGHPARSPAEFKIASYRVASAGYLKTLGVPLIAGRWIEERDREGAPAVAVVNSSFVRTYFPNESPLGQYIQLGAAPDPGVPWMEIVGVIGEVKQSLASESAAEMYLPYRQADHVLAVGAMSIVVRTTGDPRAEANAIRAIAMRLDPNQPITGIRTMEETVAHSISEPRFRTILLSMFAAIAVTLAGIGIFGVMAYSVAQRTRELGIRMALGASRKQVLQRVLVEGTRLTLVGVAVGVSASFALTRYVSAMLFNIRPYDPVTMVEVASGLIGISLAACYVPALRATMVSPSKALREQ
jgi:putative ABC transport system permease protein